MSHTVQAIFKRSFGDFAAGRFLPERFERAARAIRRCRTAALGAHTRCCPQGHVQEVYYNSCRHRACPQCGGVRAARWLDAVGAALLPTRHFHVIFTIPHELLPLWRYNQTLLTQVLFRAARDTLMQLLAEKRHLGAHPGLILSLHTWGGALVLHPHIHALVTGGGQAPDGSWKPAGKRCLVWGPILAEVFRGKFLEAVGQLLDRDQLALPPDLDSRAAATVLAASAGTPWHVNVEKPYSHGRGVAVYLARYLRGGPIKNHRIKDADARHVTFTYRDHRGSSGKPRWRAITLPARTFIARLLEHVPDSGVHVVRSYGLYSGREREQRERARQALIAAQDPPAQHPNADTIDDRSRTPRPLCPVCGSPLVITVLDRLPEVITTAQSRAGPLPALKSP